MRSGKTGKTSANYDDIHVVTSHNYPLIIAGSWRNFDGHQIAGPMS